MRAKLVIIAIILVMCSGCSTTSNTARARLDLPYPAPLRMREVKWHVLPQPENSDGKAPFIALTEDGYKNLAQNVRDASNTIGVQHRIIESYKNYYEPRK